MTQEAQNQTLSTLNLPANCFRRSRALCGSPMSENNEKTEREWRWCVYPWVWQHTRACAQHGHSRRIYFFIFVFFELYISRFFISVFISSHSYISSCVSSSNYIFPFPYLRLFLYFLLQTTYFIFFHIHLIFRSRLLWLYVYVLFLSPYILSSSSSKYIILHESSSSFSFSFFFYLHIFFL